MARLVSIVDALRSNVRLDPRHRDHPLKGDWEEYRECHIKSDWLLIYRLDDRQSYLAGTENHSDLFG